VQRRNGLGPPGGVRAGPLQLLTESKTEQTGATENPILEPFRPHIMPSPHQPDSSSVPEAPKTPTCLACGKLMRLVEVDANPNYTNLDQWCYACECGERVNNFVARRT
jgi:hypothetical protein